MSIDLQRFRVAQDHPSAGYAAALSEIRAGGKRGHWIWYIFPQLYGLGASSMSRDYGIRGVDEAEAYLRDPLLRLRLIEITEAVARLVDAGVPLETVMGSSIDACKLVSSLTLFSEVARRLAERDTEFANFAETSSDVLRRAGREGYLPCEYTLQRLRS